QLGSGRARSHQSKLRSRSDSRAADARSRLGAIGHQGIVGPCARTSGWARGRVRGRLLRLPHVTGGYLRPLPGRDSVQGAGTADRRTRRFVVSVGGGDEALLLDARVGQITRLCTALRTHVVVGPGDVDVDGLGSSAGGPGNHELPAAVTSLDAAL